MYQYSNEFSPPAPALPLECSSPLSSSSIEVLACIDSGADITVIPSNIVSRLELRRAAIITAVGFGGVPAEFPVFSVLATISGKEPLYARAIAWDREYALLGRDIINRWEVVLDGPAGRLTIA